MTGAPEVRRRESRLTRAAVLLYAVAQVFIALATVTEGRFGTDARSHVEAAGTSAHHAHDEDSCAACAARALLSTGGRISRPPAVSRAPAEVILSQIELHAGVAALASSRPRAPPLRLA